MASLFNTSELLVFGICSFLGILSNFVCLKYIWRKFDIRQILFALLFTDCAFSFFTEFGMFFVTIGFALDIQNKIFCVSYIIIYFIGYQTSYFCMATISFLRYLSVRYSMKNLILSQKETLTILGICSSVFLIMLTSTFAYFIILDNMNKPFTLGFEFCFYGEDIRDLDTFSRLLIMFEVLLCSILSVIFDIAIVKLLRIIIQPGLPEAITPQPDYLKVPIRATLAASLALLPSVGVAYLVSNRLEDSTSVKATAVMSHLALINTAAARAPLMTFLTFKVNKSYEVNTAMQNQRLVKQNAVRSWALKERNLRANFPMQPTQQTQVSSLRDETN